MRESPARTTLNTRTRLLRPLARRMSFIRRCVTFICCLLLFQLTVLGSQVACDTHGRADATRHAQHDRSHAPAPESSDDCDATGTTASCTSMPVCSVTFDVPAPVVTSVTVLSPLALLSEPVSTHSHLVSGPDAPPPRG